MFFDEKKVDSKYQELLLSIAKKQREILLERFNWNRREYKPWPPKGLFGKDKKAIARYEAMLQELEQLKAATVAHRRRQGYSLGTFWWNLPWEQVENFIVCDLAEDNGDGEWRFQRDWVVEQENDIQILLLRENGHCSNFSSNSTTHYARESIYSESEQSAMVNELHRKQKDQNFYRTLFSDDRMVYSRRSQTLYASEAAYVNSWEHYWDQANERERFARSLYTEHITQGVTVVSNSRHYECLYAVGGFCVSANGTLKLVTSFDYDLCGSRGSVPGFIEQTYADKDAVVAIAAFLADSAEVKEVPLHLFGRDIMDTAPDYSQAMRQAEIYTCLANKLQFID